MIYSLTQTKQNVQGFKGFSNRIGGIVIKNPIVTVVSIHLLKALRFCLAEIITHYHNRSTMYK